MISVRQAVQQDIPTILTIQASVFQDAVWREEDYRRMLDEPGSLMLVAQDHDSPEPVGYATVRSSCGQAELLHLAVKRARQRSGVGRALLRETCRRLQQAGVSAVYLEVRTSNTAASSLYYSLGFTLVSVRKGYYSQPVEDASILSLSLGVEGLGGAARTQPLPG